MRAGTPFGSILVFLMLLCSLHIVTSPTLVTTEEHSLSTLSGYVTHAPIVITSNGDFESQGWPGNGTMDNPYLIEGLSISADAPCVSITDTTVYFEIGGCLLNAAGSLPHNGIVLDHVTHGAVRDCIIDANLYGIYLSYSSHCTLTNNTATGNYRGFSLDYSGSCILTNNSGVSNYFGFHFYYSDSCVLTNNTAAINNYGFCLVSSDSCSLVNNTVTSSFAIGIELYSSESCTLTRNAVTSDDSGFVLYLSDSCTFTNNTVTCNNSGPGFSLGYSDSCTLTSNTIDSGLRIEGNVLSNWLHDITDNWVNEKPLGYFKSASDLSIDGSHYAQVILADCSNVTIRDGTFVHSAVGIQLGYCVNCVLTNNTAVSSQYGFYMDGSDNCTLSDNTARSNFRCGFALFDQYRCMLTYNIGTDNAWGGFYLEDAFDCTLTDNVAANNSGSGFVFWGYSESCILTHNIATNNSVDGFHLDDSDNFVLTQNVAIHNAGSGFYLDGWECTLTYNAAANNSRYGIYLMGDSHRNTLYQNRIGYNGVSNARDGGRSNSWDDGVSVGNYWSDYSGWWTYAIPGSAGSVDRYPFHFGDSNTTLNPRQLVPIFVAGFGFAVFLVEIAYVYSRRQQRLVAS